jgi:hypothetical protein
MKRKETETCPYCGAAIRKGARSCPECGSDEHTGWSERTYIDGIDLGNEIDYDEMVEREFGGGPKRRSRKLSWRVITAAILLALFVLFFLLRLF